MDYKKLLLGCLGVTVVAMLVVAALSDKQQPALTGQVSSCDMNNGDECDELHMTEHCILDDPTTDMLRTCDLTTCTWDTSACPSGGGGGGSDPNLVVSSSYLINQGAACDTATFGIKIKIENIGTGNADPSTAKVRLYDTALPPAPLEDSSGSPVNQEYSIPAIPAGGSATFTIVDTPFLPVLTAGEAFNMEVVVDIDGDVSESNEGDNVSMLGPEQYEVCGADLAIIFADGDTMCPVNPFYVQAEIKNEGTLPNDGHVIVELKTGIGGDVIAKARKNVSTLAAGDTQLLEFNEPDFKTPSSFNSDTGAGIVADLTSHHDSVLEASIVLHPSPGVPDMLEENNSRSISAHYESCLPNYVIQDVSYTYDASTCSGNEVLVDVKNEGETDGEDFRLWVDIEETSPDGSTTTHSEMIFGPLLTVDTENTYSVPFSFVQDSKNTYSVSVEIEAKDTMGLIWEEMEEGNTDLDREDLIDASVFCMANLKPVSMEAKNRCILAGPGDDGYFLDLDFVNDGNKDTSSSFSITATTGPYSFTIPYPSVNAGETSSTTFRLQDLVDDAGNSPTFVPGDMLTVTFDIDSTDTNVESIESDNVQTFSEIEYKTCVPNLIPTLSEGNWFPVDDVEFQIISSVQNDSLPPEENGPFVNNVSITYVLEDENGNVKYQHTAAGQNFAPGEVRPYNISIPKSSLSHVHSEPYRLYMTVDSAETVVETVETDNAQILTTPLQYNEVIDQVTENAPPCLGQDASFTIDYSNTGVPAPPQATTIEYVLRYKNEFGAILDVSPPITVSTSGNNSETITIDGSYLIEDTTWDSNKQYLLSLTLENDPITIDLIWGDSNNVLHPFEVDDCSS